MGPLTLKLCLHRCLISDFLTSEGQKPHPQVTLGVPIFGPASHGEASQPGTPAQNTDALALSLPTVTFSHAFGHLTRKDPDAGRDWGQEEKGMIEDEMAGWHH